MKFNYLILIFYLSSFATPGQYGVLEAKKITNQNGDKVRKGDFLLKTDTISIAEKGHLTLDVESAMRMKLASGMYIVGEESERHNEWYSTHLRLTNKLKRLGLISCKFRYKTLVVPGSDRHFEVDRIEIDQKGLVVINSDTVSLSIKWANPDYKYKGTYYLVIRDFYNQGFIDILETEEDHLEFYPARYGHKHIYYSIITETCRASLRYKIEVNSPETYSYSETSFFDPDN